MTDRELLELAARAAGYGLPGEPDHDEIGRRHSDALGLWVRYPWGWEWFNPLGRDDHALRLAVKLQLTVCNEHVSAGVAYCMRGDDEIGESVQSGDHEPEVIEADYAATRRAITRAAAEIGRAGGGG